MYNYFQFSQTHTRLVTVFQSFTARYDNDQNSYDTWRRDRAGASTVALRYGSRTGARGRGARANVECGIVLYPSPCCTQSVIEIHDSVRAPSKRVKP
jgi:hypothetical protein